MPFDLEKLTEFLFMLLIGLSTLLLTVAIAWRLTVKSTVRALLEYRAARAGADPLLAQQVTELAEEVRGLTDKVATVTEGELSRPQAADVSWHPTRQKA